MQFQLNDMVSENKPIVNQRASVLIYRRGLKEKGVTLGGHTGILNTGVIPFLKQNRVEQCNNFQSKTVW